jgi:CheY-like chemotaxis protein/nitrogen-specific signal transduction histidine kinase
MDVFEMTPLQCGAHRGHVLACSSKHDSKPELPAAFVPESTEQRQAETDRLARHEAERANRAKSEFLSTMSHELRTPLNAILGYAQYLGMDKGLNERQRRSIQAIHDSGNHLLSLIVDILDLSRIEAQRLELVPTPVELRPFLRSVAEVMRVKADEKGLALALDAACNLPDVVLVDQRRLRQVLLNLLGNAVKFTDRGTVSLCVSEVRREVDQSLVRIDVRDTGVGISPQDLPTIFEPFEQVGDVRRREAGTGLGLTITRALVAAMGGEIRVTSELGRGTQFSFTLRMNHADPPDRPSPSEGRPARYEGHRRRVLVIDDDVHARAIFADFLGSIGFECQVAEDGLQGIDKVHGFVPDVVLMDTLMPGISGLEATRRLRSDPALAHLPIIAVSANAAETDRQDCLQAGANICLSKPVRLDELACAIQQLLHLVPRPHTEW